MSFPMQQAPAISQDVLDQLCAGMKWPATKQQVMAHARNKKLPQQAMKALQAKLGDGKTFNNAQELQAAARA